ncbi:MAG: hypothetical protein QNL61_08540 [Crocinitomicaceae bacterium]
MKEILQLNSLDSSYNQMNHLIGSSDDAFLDDYVFTIKALLDL